MKGRHLLLVSIAALAGCASEPAKVDEAARVERDTAETRALIAAMKEHPSLQDSQDGSAAGKAISVPTTIPPRPKGSDDDHTHGHTRSRMPDRTSTGRSSSRLLPH